MDDVVVSLSHDRHVVVVVMQTQSSYKYQCLIQEIPLSTLFPLLCIECFFLFFYFIKRSN